MLGLPDAVRHRRAVAVAGGVSGPRRADVLARADIVSRILRELIELAEDDADAEQVDGS